MGNKFLRLAVVYLLIGVCIGVMMAKQHDHTLAVVHAHINLLGWASMFLFGLFYRAFPEAERSVFGYLHFWIHNIALPIQMVSLAMLVSGNESVEGWVAGASVAIVVGLVFFAINVWNSTRNG